MRHSLTFISTALLSACASVPNFDTATTQRLAPCPDAPRCVSSHSPEPDHHIAPFAVGSDNQWQYLQQLLTRLPRTRIITRTEDYLHVEQRSPIMGYRDDIEFLYLPQQKRVDVRSAARIGYYDFQVNRRRIEAIRLDYLRRFAPQPSLSPPN